MGKYDDIIDMPHYEPKKHPRMTLANRAAQFAPFAALSGHDEAINETARLTESERNLSQDEMNMLSRKIAVIIGHMDDSPQVDVTYFCSDSRKAGGHYAKVSGIVCEIDEYERTMTFDDGSVVLLDNVISIEGKLLENCF